VAILQNLKIDGLKDLDKALSQLPDNVAKRALKKGVMAGAIEIRKEIRNRAPFRHIKRAIIVLQANRSGTSVYTVSYDIGINLKKGRPRAPDWHWWEFGIPHSWTIVAGSRKGKRLVSTGKVKLYAEPLGKFLRKPQNILEHPPIAARPFLRPGVEAATPKALEALRRMLSQAIIMEASKLARKG
jgi:hypothetical protein